MSHGDAEANSAAPKPKHTEQHRLSASIGEFGSLVDISHDSPEHDENVGMKFLSDVDPPSAKSGWNHDLKSGTTSFGTTIVWQQ